MAFSQSENIAPDKSRDLIPDLSPGLPTIEILPPLRSPHFARSMLLSESAVGILGGTVFSPYSLNASDFLLKRPLETPLGESSLLRITGNTYSDCMCNQLVKNEGPGRIVLDRILMISDKLFTFSKT